MNDKEKFIAQFDKDKTIDLIREIGAKNEKKNEIKNLKAAIANYPDLLKIVDDREQYLGDIFKLDQTNESLRKEIQSLEQKLDLKNEKISDLKKEIEQRKNSVLQKENNLLHKKIKRINNELIHAKKDFNLLKTKAQEVVNQYNNLYEKYEELTNSKPKNIIESFVMQQNKIQKLEDENRALKADNARLYKRVGHIEGGVRLSQECIAKIIELGLKGKSYKQIADETNCSEGSVGNYLKLYREGKIKVTFE